MVIAHTSLPVKEYESAKKFYTDVLGAIGYTQNMEYGTAAGFNDGKNTDFWIFRNTEVIPMHVAFEVPSIDMVHAFYAAALKAGGTDNGAPGYRKDYWPGYYAAFVHDPDGHNIEAVFYDYEAK
ncbi:MAG TPA: VOC family protein [Candidatus Paceibacterota bacterium]|nr:VOC family protein [Candidatus Paceibacterota bacterium]